MINIIQYNIIDAIIDTFQKKKKNPERKKSHLAVGMRSSPGGDGTELCFKVYKSNRYRCMK